MNAMMFMIDEMGTVREEVVMPVQIRGVSLKLSFHSVINYRVLN
jgi:hypothetical protein